MISKMICEVCNYTYESDEMLDVIRISLAHKQGFHDIKG